MLRDKKNWRKLNNRAGFSTVELIVVIVITLILAGSAVIGVSAWIKKLAFQEQNNMARSIFVAAQNQMTEYENNGQMEAFREIFQDPATYKSGTMLLANENAFVTGIKLRKNDKDVVLQEVWKQAASTVSADKKVTNDNKPNNGSEKESAYRGSIVSVLLTEADYQNYVDAKNGKGTIDSRKRAIYDLFIKYLYDPSILKAAVCVEFSPEAGQIMSVFYSDMQSAFEYNDANTSLEGLVDISDRSAAYRSERMVGYYGVDSLVKSTSSQKERPVVSNLKLYNSDSLYLSFALKKVPAATSELNYDITVYDNASNKALMTISLPGGLRNRDYRETKDCEVYIYGQDGKDIKATFPVLAWVDEKNYVNVILDAMDESAPSVSFYEDQKIWDGLQVSIKDGAPLYQYNGITDTSFQSLMQRTGNPQKLKNTLSFHRFGLDSEDIYCMVQGYGDLYQNTAVKRSNVQNTYFGSLTMTTAGGKNELIYTVENPRHLYNIRYYEDCSAEDFDKYYGYYDNIGSIHYRVTENITWDQTTNMELFDGCDVALGERYFPSIRQLRKEDVLEGKKSLSGKHVLINNLAISADKNDRIYRASESGLFADAQTDKSAGLFLVNYGAINDLTFLGLQVSGEKNVGGICAIDAGGRIADLNMGQAVVTNDSAAALARGHISGKENVGSIVGKICVVKTLEETNNNIAKSASLENLVNYALVTEAEGYENVRNLGGIAGMAECSSNSHGSVVIDKCKNYGPINALDHGTGMQTECLGGIVGYVLGSTPLGKATLFEKVTLTSCTSTPQYTEEELGANYEKLETLLNGWYVGGIVGYNDGGELALCSTQKENSKAIGYIFGDRYVGGIIGYNHAQKSYISGENGGKATRNEAHVLGNTFVGGVVGYNPAGIIKSWENVGFVGATTEYAGGITGANGVVESAKGQSFPGAMTVLGEDSSQAIVAECFGNVPNGMVETKLSGLKKAASSKPLFMADCVGGVAGYNDGILAYNAIIADGAFAGYSTDTSKVSALVSNVTGGKFVGGVVGYNDVHSTVAGYAVGGGVVKGESFVGGYVGLNASLNLLMEGSYKAGGVYDYSAAKARVLESNPNAVLGSYCVGGTIGANIIPVPQGVQEIKAGFTSSHFLGYVGYQPGSTSTAEAYVGGFIGYNLLYTSDKTDERAIKEELQGILTAGDSEDLFLGSDKKLLYPEKLFASISDEAHRALYRDSNGNMVRVTMTIEGKGNAAGDTARFGGIRAKLMVGGVLGYNDENTQMVIKDVENMSPVVALGAVSFPEEWIVKWNADQNTGKDITLSYAGGIVGKVTQHTTLQNCSNKEQGMVTTTGFYTGGLCEINEGTITQCKVVNIGTTALSYVGGIAGVNYQNAKIQNVDMTGATITGKNYVGGIAAENFGTIEGTYGTNTHVVGHGDYVGGIVGMNYAGAAIKLSASGAQGAVEVSVASSGQYIGGIAGMSQAAIGQDDGKMMKITGSVSGKRYVGGIVGDYNGSEKLAGLFNLARVTALEGNAGGIAGRSGGTGSIICCMNVGDISSTQSGNAAGIVAETSAAIEACGNSGHVLAENGKAGGIAVYNNGAIKDCYVFSDVSKLPDGKLKTALAGDAQANNSGVKVEGQKGAGGIAAENNGKTASIKNCQLLGALVENTAKSPLGCYVGGITAQNGSDAQIVNCVVKDSTVTALTSECYVGGIAGKNQAIIENDASFTEASVQGSVLTMSANCYGSIGGIAGYNGWEMGDERNETAPIKLENMKVQADILGQLGAEGWGLGGIAGVNAGSILDCDYDGCADNKAYLDGKGTAAEAASLAADAGNHAIKSLNDFHGILGLGTSANAVILGGMVGYNGETGVVEGCIVGRNYDTAIYGGTSKANSSVTGGLVGWNCGTVRNCDNAKYSNHNVFMLTYAGHNGGLIGRNNATGYVLGTEETPNSTSDKWCVVTCFNANDCGTAGIIGYSKSGYDIPWAVNRAHIVHYYNQQNDKNIALGGIVGRMENSAQDTMTFRYCSNHGRIDGSIKTICGGILGRSKYYGASFDHCENTGYIQGGDAAGIVGDYNVVSRISLIYSCNNYGDIKALDGSGNAGGISANAMKGGNGATPTTPGTLFADCVNTGTIYGKNIGGICGVRSVNKNTYFYRCRNYGLGAPTDAKNNPFCGIAKYNDPTSMKECLSFGNTVRLLQNKASSTVYKNNYIGIENRTVAVTGDYIFPVYAVENDGMFDLLFQKNDTVYMQGLQINPLDYTVDRKTVYEKVDPEYLKTYYELVGAPSWTNNTKFSYGLFELVWNMPDNCMTQEITYYYEDLDENNQLIKHEGIVAALPYGVDRYRFMMPEEWLGKKIQFIITAYSYDREKKASATKTLTVSGILPEPKVHLELMDDDKYYAVLDNYEDYLVLKENPVSGEMEQVLLDENIVVKGKFLVDYKIPLANGNFRSQALAITATNASDTPNVAYAVGAKNYGDSTAVPVETRFQPVSNLRSTANMSIVYSGKDFANKPASFFGDLPSNLYYSQVITPANGVEDYIITEIVAQNYLKIGESSFDLSVSSGLSHVAKIAEVTSTLGNIPEDLFVASTGVTTRTYFWISQNNAIWFGHDVDGAKEITYQQLSELVKAAGSDQALMDTRRLQPAAVFVKEGDQVKTAPGYQIKLNEDGTYSIFYSVLVHHSSQTSSEYADTSKGYDKQVLVQEWNSVMKMASTPVIEEECVFQSNEAGDEYLFTWKDVTAADIKDAVKDRKTAKFQLILTGIESDGEMVKLQEVLLDTAKASATAGFDYDEKTGIWSYVVADPTKSWNYPTLKLQVIRQGEVNVTASADNGSTSRYPTYDIQEYEMPLRLAQLAAPTLTILDKNDLKYQIDWTNLAQEMRGEIRDFQIVIQELDADGNVVDTKAIDTLMEDYLQKEQLTYSPLDLSEFNGKKVLVSVRVLSKDTTKYMDGEMGVPVEMTLPTRLRVPNAAELFHTPKYSFDNQLLPGGYLMGAQRNPYVVLDELKESGLTLTYQDQDGDAENDIQARYEIAAAIYMDAPTSQDKTDTALVDGSWHQGAEAVLIYKSGEEVDGLTVDPTLMNGSLQNSVYTLNYLTHELQMRYAGRWIKVVLRAVSDGNISSYWSDEDPSGESVNYVWIQIPRVQLGIMDVAVGEKDVTYQLQDDRIFSLRQRENSFEIQELADGYLLTLVDAPKVDDNVIKPDLATQVQYVDWFYLRRMQGDGSLEVYYAGTGPWAPAGTVAMEDFGLYGLPRMTDLGSVAAGESLITPMAQTVVITAQYSVEPHAVLSLSEDGKVISVLMPDVLGESAGVTTVVAENLMVDQFTLQAIAETDNQQYFENSQITKLNAAGQSGVMEQYLEPVDGAVSNLQLQVSYRDGVSYELSGKANGSRVLYELTVLGNRYYYSAGTLGEIGSELDTLVCLGQEVKDLAPGTEISVRVARIVNNNGIGRWADAGVLTVPEKADITQKLGETDQLEIYTYDNNPSTDTIKVTVQVDGQTVVDGETQYEEGTTKTYWKNLQDGQYLLTTVEAVNKPAVVANVYLIVETVDTEKNFYISYPAARGTVASSIGDQQIEFPEINVTITK